MPASDARPVDLAAQIDALENATGKTEALASVVTEWFDGASRNDAGPLQVEQLGHLLGSIADAAAAAVAAFDWLHVVLADVQRPPERDYWSGEGTTSGT